MATREPLPFAGPTADDLVTYTGSSRPADDDAVQRALAVAKAEVDRLMLHRFRDPDEDTYNQLVLEVGDAELARTASPSGTSQYADFSTGQPVRGARDPLTRIWPQLARLVPGF